MEVFKISIAAARVNAELTQQQAADKLGVNKATLSNWECGKTIPNAEHYRAMAVLYGIPLSFLRV